MFIKDKKKVSGDRLLTDRSSHMRRLKCLVSNILEIRYGSLPYRLYLLYKGLITPRFKASFSSAPPPAIEISTPWEIIVRVSSAFDLPRTWQLLGGLSRLHLPPLSEAFGLPSRGLWIPFSFRSSSLSTLAWMFLPFTPHFAKRLT